MIAFAMITAAWAQDVIAIKEGEGQAPAGVVVEWSAPSPALDVSVAIRNNTSAVLEVDWNRSAYVYSSGRSVGIISGGVRIGDAGALVPPSIIPPGAALAELLYRRDSVSVDEVQPLMGGEVGGDTSVTLTTSAGVISQRWHLALDEEATAAARIAAARAAEIAAARQAASLQAATLSRQASDASLLAEQRDGRAIWGLVIGGLGVAATLGSAVNGESEAAAGGVFVGLAGGALWGVSKLKAEEAREEAAALRTQAAEAQAIATQ